MIRRQSGHPRVSVVIPLFRSSRFVDTVAANVESLPRRDVEIVISDRHCHDDAIDRLAQRFAADPRVRFLKHRDRLDWVGHVNALLGSARGDYWRFLPHDDLSPPGSMEALIAALDDHPEALLAYGPTQAVDADGRRLPDLDRPAPHPGQAGQGWTLGLALEMFWRGHFDGAFKGLIRRQAVRENRLLIRSTAGQQYPERCWLFALCLLGRFRFVPEAVYVKRFHPDSTHARWKPAGSNYYSAARVMSGYLWDLVDPLPARWYGMQDLWLNARRVARWCSAAGNLPRPAYRAAPGLAPWLLGRKALARSPALRKVLAASHARVDSLRRLPLPHPRARASP